MWTTIAQFILSLSILIVLHELGHFATAKWFKTRVEKFYLFFNPWFSLFKFQYGETEYGLGWLPLGGYVKISGMIDESMDKEQMKGPPQPWEFRSKPAWQRLIIMVGGVFVNFVLGIFLFSMVFLVWGEKFLPAENVKEGIAVEEMGYEMGLREGDKILKIGDKAFTKFNPGLLNKALIIDNASTVEVERNGATTVIPIDEKYGRELSKYENRNKRLFQLRIPAIVNKLNEDSKANPGKAGLKEKDEVIAVDGKSTPYYFQFEKAVMQSTDDHTRLTVKRGLDTLDINYMTFIPKRKSLIRKILGKEAEKVRKLGFYPQTASNFYKFDTQEFSFGQAVSKGWNESWSFLGDQISAFGKMFTGKIKAKDSLGSFITIGKLFGTDWDWRNFWWMTAVLSILLGFFNLLPIPALDGGYVMFLLFESITGMKVPDRVMEITTLVGFILLICLMLFAFGLDISRLF